MTLLRVSHLPPKRHLNLLLNLFIIACIPLTCAGRLSNGDHVGKVAREWMGEWSVSRTEVNSI